MFQRVLIANRGEIAVRIARACAELGVACVGVHARDDAASLARAPLERVLALPRAGARAYLDVDAVLAAARDSGCDAVHPGYGFLSENAAFAQACADAGLVFVGPSPEVLRRFGDKTAARALAQRLEVPVPRGSAGAVGRDEAHAFFARLPAGRAMIVKALAGGGGRGMRVVRRAEEIDEALERCRSEALAGFGNGDVYVEECLERARHVEVQIVGDGSGAVVALGERECTLQRRHQKLVEIAPSPSLDDDERTRLAAMATRMAAEVRYRGLGTFEFLCDADRGDIVFIEANPRLQVEHTVTEETWGVDLVQAQLRVCAGQTLAQAGLGADTLAAPRGCAVQLRVNAEAMQRNGDAHSAAGTLVAYRPPSGPGIRIDDYAEPGVRVHPSFDSLLAKVIVRQPSGDHAALMRRALVALSSFRVDGVTTNLAFLHALLRHPDVVDNRVTTRWIDAHAAGLLADVERSQATERASARAPVAGASDVDGRDAATLAAEGEVRAPDAVADRSDAEAALLADATLHAIRAPMHGVLAAFEAAEGDLVHAGQPVAILESMKMEHVVAAAEGARIERLVPALGDVLEPGALVAIVTPIDAQALPALEAAEHDPDAIRPDLAEVLERLSYTLDERRPQAVARRHAQGGRTARENIADLCDEGSFVEYGALGVAAQRTRRSMDELIRTTPGDGVITGVGTVNAATFGARDAACVVIAYDYTVLAGTQGFIGHQKQDRILAVAETLRRPLVLFAEGGGGRPGDADEDHRLVAGLHLTTFRMFARLSAAVPVVGIVHGRCFAGNAALLGCCDVIIATRASTIGMGGPAMIEGGGLGVVRADDVGPVDVLVPNGVIDVLVDDEAQAVAVARQYLSYFQGRVTDWQCADQRELRRLVPENRLRAYDVRAVIATLADSGSVLEIRPRYGVGIVTALVRIEGRPFGLIANNPSHLGGAIDPPASDKASRFLQLCDAFDLPVISLCDTPGFMVGPAVEREAMVRRCCRMFLVGANVDVPYFTIVLRKGYGLGAMAMAGGGFHAPLFTVAWPSGEFGGMGLEGAVRLGFRNELAAIADPAARDAEFRRLVDALYARGKALNMASLLEIDQVIDPSATRAWIVRMLDSVTPPAGGRREGIARAMRKKRAHVDSW